jgi:hypothetical protein
LRTSESVTLVNIAMVFAILIDELNVASDDGVINARPFLGWRASYWTAYLTSPMFVDESFSAYSTAECGLRIRIKTVDRKSSGFFARTALL